MRRLFTKAALLCSATRVVDAQLTCSNGCIMSADIDQSLYENYDIGTDDYAPFEPNKVSFTTAQLLPTNSGSTNCLYTKNDLEASYITVPRDVSVENEETELTLEKSFSGDPTGFTEETSEQWYVKIHWRGESTRYNRPVLMVLLYRYQSNPYTIYASKQLYLKQTSSGSFVDDDPLDSLEKLQEDACD